MQVVSIILPKLGESVADATILKWLVQPGDTIEKDQIIAEVATDKVDTDLFSEYNGIIKSIAVAEGEMALVGAIIAIVEVANIEQAEITQNLNEIPTSTITPKETISKQATIEKGQLLTAETSLYLTPVVRNIAAKAHLTPEDLQKIPRSGSNQTRITKKDVLNYLNPPPQAVPVIKKRELRIDPTDQVIELSRIRKLIARHMSESSQTAAHVTSWVIADVSSIVKWRELVKLDFQEKYQTKLTYTHVFMSLVVESLLQFPKLNAWYDGVDQLVLKKAINLGFAAATPDDNLIVPNLKDAEHLSLIEIANGVNQLGTAAKSSQLQAGDITDSTFTISNTGIFGSLMGTPILALPQVAILAFGEIASAPGIVIAKGKEEIAIVKQMHLSLSYDHRIVDGAYASRFLSDLKSRIKNFKGVVI